jgi:transposase
MVVTVLSGPERRRRWSSTEKRQIVQESLAPAASVAAVARRHDMHPNLLHQWRRQARTGALGYGIERLDGAGGGVRFAAVALAPERGPLAPERSASGLLEIKLASGTRVRIGGAVEPATIVAAVSALLRHERRR